jgi:hypothetical protein
MEGGLPQDRQGGFNQRNSFFHSVEGREPEHWFLCDLFSSLLDIHLLLVSPVNMDY